MTITAAPYLRQRLAVLTNFSSPSLRLMELTIDLPCITFNPASITSHLEESIMIGTFDISGSEATSFKKLSISSIESNMPSSIFTSIIWAPKETCSLATSSAAA